MNKDEGDEAAKAEDKAESDEENDEAVDGKRVEDNVFAEDGAEEESFDTPVGGVSVPSGGGLDSADAEMRDGCGLTGSALVM